MLLRDCHQTPSRLKFHSRAGFGDSPIKFKIMGRLQDVFNNIEKLKKDQREIKKAYKDALSTSHEYGEVVEKVNELRDKKRKIEDDIKEDFSSEFTRLEDLKIDLETEKEMLSDIALNKLVKGEKVEVKDKNDVAYEPIFSVKFKKPS